MTDEVLSLPPREKEVADLLLEALSDSEIAIRLGTSERNVKRAMHSMYQRFGIRGGVNRIRLAVALHERRSQLNLRCVGCP